MTDQAEKIIREHLRAICGDMSTMRGDLLDLRLRVSGLESHVANLVSDALRVSVRLDTIVDRLVRIEHRLELQV